MKESTNAFPYVPYKETYYNNSNNEGNNVKGLQEEFITATFFLDRVSIQEVL